MLGRDSEDVVGSQAKPTDTPIGAPAPTSPQRPIKAGGALPTETIVPKPQSSAKDH